ncbi:glycoside hydrolase [Lophiotrema nucula]|uniref:AA9 family lytic polysaccharide monooxygenase n=1 Tax=Lophiotrema nucula TaxID=690887 RepID=A0A6A5ZVM0_9PLEO|nr:glycoside hydrolase [Lophiotrema nucula]
MHLSTLFTLSLLSIVDAHYLFGRLIFENRWTDTWEYIREITPYKTTDAAALVYPNTDPDSNDVRCGRNASTAWSKAIKTAVIKAGDTVGFGAGEPYIAGWDKGRMYHPGFGSAWLSRAPTDDLIAYTGDGDWFKILQIVNRTEQSVNFTKEGLKPDPVKMMWGTYLADSWNFTIPAKTPAGKYLLRFEHIFANRQDSQFYVNCAHIEIVNPSQIVGTPGPLVKIPGVYVRGQPDVYFSTYDYALDPTMTFVPPKPVVWTG